jgi:hypothetical protein
MVAEVIQVDVLPGEIECLNAAWTSGFHDCSIF